MSELDKKMSRIQADVLLSAARRSMDELQDLNDYMLARYGTEWTSEQGYRTLTNAVNQMDTYIAMLESLKSGIEE